MASEPHVDRSSRTTFGQAPGQFRSGQFRSGQFRSGMDRRRDRAGIHGDAAARLADRVCDLS